jgi:tRNA A-37 threonylcarbamoyl transferase component Bud32
VLRNFIYQRRGDIKIWVDRSYADPAFVEILADPDRLFEDSACEVIKDQRKIKVGNLPVRIAGIERRIYVKRYNAFSLRYRLGSVFTRSGGLKSLQGAAILQQAGIHTAKPVAAIEARAHGALCKSFFLSEEIAGGMTADAGWIGQLKQLTSSEGFGRRRTFLAELGKLFRLLHSEGIYHNDLKDANILTVPARDDCSFSFFLLDLEGVRRYRSLSEKRTTKNLVQLNRTLGRYLSAAQKLMVLKNYLGDSFSNRRLRRKLVADVVRESKRLDAMKVRSGLSARSAAQINHG